jgi:hypothetical protein
LFKKALRGGTAIDFQEALEKAMKRYPTPEGYFSDEIKARYDSVYHLEHPEAYKILENAMPPLPQPSASPSPNPTPSSPSSKIVTANPVTSTGGGAITKLISDFGPMKAVDAKKSTTADSHQMGKDIKIGEGGEYLGQNAEGLHVVAHSFSGPSESQWNTPITSEIPHP